MYLRSTLRRNKDGARSVTCNWHTACGTPQRNGPKWDPSPAIGLYPVTSAVGSLQLLGQLSTQRPHMHARITTPARISERCPRAEALRLACSARPHSAAQDGLADAISSVI